MPVRDAIDAQVGLGYPDGFTGEPPAASITVTDRDRGLLALAQRAALRREHEIVLDDTQLDSLTGPAPTGIRPTAELTVRVHALQPQARQTLHHRFRERERETAESFTGHRGVWPCSLSPKFKYDDEYAA